MRRALLSLAASVAAISAVVPSVASAASVGPCNVGANTPTLQPDPVGYTGGPRIGFTAGVSCSQTASSLGITATLQIYNGGNGVWYNVQGASNSGAWTTFVGVGRTHDNGCDGCLYRTVATGTTPWGSVSSTSPGYRAP